MRAARLVTLVIAVTLVAAAVWAPGSYAATKRGKARASNTSIVEGFGVSPMLLELDVKPGKTVNTAVTITNTTADTADFVMATEDVSGSKTDPNSSPLLMGGAFASSISGASWIVPEANSIRLAPGESRDLGVKVSAPSGASGGHYAAMTVAISARKIGNGVTAQSRAAVLFFMNAGGTPPPEIVIQDVVVTEQGETIIDYVNEGDTGTKPDATVTYEDPITGRTIGTGKSGGAGGSNGATGDAGTGSSSCTYALPGAMGRCTITVHEKNGSLVRGGKVVLTNDGRTARAPVPTEWTGSGTSLLLPLLGIGLLVLYFAFLRRRSKGEEDIDPDDPDGLLVV